MSVCIRLIPVGEEIQLLRGSFSIVSIAGVREWVVCLNGVFPNPQRKEKRTIKWNPKVHFLRSLDAVVGNTLIWLGHNSFFLQVGGKRFMIDPVYGSIPFVKRRSQFPANPSIFTNIDYLLISHDHFDHLDKPSVARLFVR